MLEAGDQEIKSEKTHFFREVTKEVDQEKENRLEWNKEWWNVCFKHIIGCVALGILNVAYPSCV